MKKHTEIQVTTVPSSGEFDEININAHNLPVLQEALDAGIGASRGTCFFSLVNMLTDKAARYEFLFMLTPDDPLSAGSKGVLYIIPKSTEAGCVAKRIDNPPKFSGNAPLQ